MAKKYDQSLKLNELDEQANVHFVGQKRYSILIPHFGAMPNCGGSSHGVQTRWVKQVSQILATNKCDLNLESPRNNRMVMVSMAITGAEIQPETTPEASGADGEHCSAGEGEEQRSPGGASEVKLVAGRAGSIENMDPRNMVPQTLNIIKHYEALFLGVNQMITIFDFAELENRDCTWSHF